MGKHLLARTCFFPHVRFVRTVVVIALSVMVGAIPAMTGAGSLAAEESGPCPDGGEITITRTLPAGVPRPATFGHTVTGPWGSGFSAQAPVTFVSGDPNTKSVVVETPAGVVGDFLVHEESRPEWSAPAPDATLRVSATSEPPCANGVTFTGSSPLPSTVRVFKSESVAGFTRKAKGRWTFRLSGGPSDISITKITNTNGDDHALVFKGLFRPGEYTLCERFAGGWKSDLGRGMPGRFLRPNGDRCVTFLLEAGEIQKFRVTNRCSRL